LRLKIHFPGLLILALLLAACAQAAPALTDPTDTAQPATQPVENPVGPVDETPTPAYPGPDQPVEMPTDTKPDQTAGYEPRPGDEQLDRGSVFVEAFDILTLESYPPQFMLHLSGNLPTPCHELRAVVSGPGKGSRINVELYSLSDPDMICIQVLAPFEASIPLGSYTEGSYLVTLNDDQQVGVIEP
jgi:hypothetical protein